MMIHFELLPTSKLFVTPASSDDLPSDASVVGLRLDRAPR